MIPALLVVDPGVTAVRDRVHLLALRLYARLPRRSRRRVVRALTPSYTVGAICLIEGSGDEVLLLRQVYRRDWGVPGGHLKRGEAPDAAVRREALEEVGLALDLIGEPAVVVDADARRVDVVYRATPAAGFEPDLVKAVSPEIAEVGWFSLRDLPDLQEETVQALEALGAWGNR